MSLKAVLGSKEAAAVSCIPIFTDNYVWVLHDSTSPRRVAIVDPGDANAVYDFIESHGLEPCAILVTHHHSDHTGGVSALARAYGASVYASAGDPCVDSIQSVRDSRRVALPRLDLEVAVLDVPGHTKDHVAYVTRDAVFCGDVLFSGGCGRIIEGNSRQMWRSLRSLARLPRRTRVYCAHEYTMANLRFAIAVEPANLEIRRYQEACARALKEGRRTVPSTIARELEINPFLRCGSPSVHAAAERYAGRRLHCAADVFAVLRGWKDEFPPAAAAAL